MQASSKSFGWVLGLVLAPAIATAGSEIDSLRQQIEADQGAAAWKQAKNLRQRYEGEPAFDFLYGQAALANGQPAEAMFALARVVAAEPGNLEARILLARAAVESGDQEQARAQYVAVLAGNPTGPQRREAENFLGRTGTAGTESTLTGYVEAMLGHDNNVNSATGASTINAPGFEPIDLDRAASKTSDMYSQLGAGLDFYKPLGNDRVLELKGRVGERNNFSSDTFDTNRYYGSVGLRQQWGREIFRVAASAQDMRLSDSDYQNIYGLKGDWIHQVNQELAIVGSVYTNLVRYQEDDIRDVNQYAATGGVQYVQGLFTHTAGLIVGNEDPLHDTIGEHNARNFNTLYYDVKYAVAPEHQLYARAFLQDSHQLDQDPLFVERREDVMKYLMAGYAWQLDKHWRWKTEVGYTDNNSDIDYYSYERTFVQTGVRYSF